MKVFLITTSTFPNGMADTNRIKCYAKAILSKGEECEVVIYKRNNGFSNIEPTGISQGIPYKYVGNKSRRSTKTIVARYFDLVDRILLFLYLLHWVRPGDVVLCYGSLYSTLLIKALRLRKVCFIANLTEYPFLYSKRTISKRIYEWIITKRLFPNYDGVIAISEELVEFTKQYCSIKCKIIKLPILVDYEKYNLTDKSLISKEKYIFHAGSLLESKDGILGMLEAFGRFKLKSNAPIKFYSTGYIERSPHAIQINSIIKKYNLNKDVQFLGFLSDEEYHQYLQEASLVVINKNKSIQNKYCFSTKLGEYMAAGKAIIITNVGEAMNWVRDKEEVLIIESDNVDLLADAICEIFGNEDLRLEISKKAKRACKILFDYNQYGNYIIDLFKDISRYEHRD